MIITSYHFKWEKGCDFAATLEDADAPAEVIEKVTEQIDDRYHSFHPYGPREDDTLTFASRFEQDVLDVIDNWDEEAFGALEYEIVRVDSETGERI